MQNEIIKKILTNFRADYALISTSNISLYNKLDLLWRKYFCIFSNKRSIKYLGKDFHYDNRFSPVMLEEYPKEISEIDSVIDFSKIKTVLDIGANIGQFALTLKTLYPQINLHSFEPNEDIYPILKKNLSDFNNLTTHNFGIGNKPGIQTFYFSPSASAEGSLFQENMNQNFVRKNIQKTRVKIVKLNPSIMKKLGIPRKVDLIKIDVEGAEMDVIRSLKSIDFDYLYVEVSIKRKGGGSLKEIKELLKKEKGIDPKLIYYNVQSKFSSCANVIFSLKR